MDRLKDLSTPFTLYDFFGYLLPGFFFLILLILEYDGGDIMNFYVSNQNQPNSLLNFETTFTKTLKLDYLMNFLLEDNSFSFIPFLVLILLVYLTGHVIASISSFILEKGIVEEMLGYPSMNLLIKKKHFFLKEFLFRAFLQPFDEGFIKEFRSVFAKRYGEETSLRNAFWLCFTDITRHTPIGYKRVVHFLNLYGFARNISMCFLLYILFRIVVLKCLLQSQLNLYNWLILIGYFIVSIVMFYNYLKLFNRQCKELYYHFYSFHTDNFRKSEVSEKEIH